jgi:DNA-binding NarL/FixJ family response regulator
VKPLTVVVVDDHGLTLSAVSDSLAINGLTVLARARDAVSAVNAVIKFQPDALLTDLDLGPGPSGIHIAVSVRKRFPLLGVVILSGYSDPRLLSASVPDAPSGSVYLVKHQIDDTRVVVAAVRDAVERARVGAEASVPALDLTRTQVTVLDLLSRGLTNAAIADRLSVSEDTIAKHVTRMAKKLGISKGEGTNVRGALTGAYFAFVGNPREP